MMWCMRSISARYTLEVAKDKGSIAHGDVMCFKAAVLRQRFCRERIARSYKLCVDTSDYTIQTMRELVNDAYRASWAEAYTNQEVRLSRTSDKGSKGTSSRNKVL
jgi:hypothetical protein